MSVEKIYKSLTKGETAIYRGTKTDANGRILHTLLIGDEEREIHDVTLKRWWVLIQEKTLEEPIEVAEKVEAPKKEEPKKEAKKERKTDNSGVLDFFEKTITELGGTIKPWSEPAKRVILDKNKKPVMFYWVTRNKTVKICLKEELDSAIKCSLKIEVKNSFPKQYPYRIKIDRLSKQTEELIRNILTIYI